MASASKTKSAVNNKALTQRNSDYAGQSVKQGDYTVRYGNQGQVNGYVKDGGASATAQYQTTHANDSEYHKAAYQAAQAGNWDEAGRIMNQYSEANGQTGETGVLNLKASNDYLRELQNQFGYNATTYYDKLYDQAHGERSAATYDATGGAIKTYAQLVNAVGADKAQSRWYSPRYTAGRDTRPSCADR